MWHIEQRGETHRRFWRGNLGTEGRIILKWILKNQDGRAWTGLIWLRMVTNMG
jgi:hypothetical protein